MSGSPAHVILSRARLKPHRTEYWMMTDDSRPELEERLGEICGLYVDPPENLLVVSIDEKTGDPGEGADQARPATEARHAGAPRARVHPQRHPVPVRVLERAWGDVLGKPSRRPAMGGT